MPVIDKQRAERQRRRILARMRFKSLVRKTIINNYWLSELEDKKLTDNVKKNVTIIMKRKGTKELLSILEKTVLNIPADQRTVEQKRKLVPLLLDMPCFNRFSPITRAQLVNYIYFYFVNKQRIILREGHHASAVYFILSGEVNISKKRYNTALKIYEEEVVGTYVSGDMFGEVAVVKNMKRSATISAETDCELLCIYNDDFNRILKPILQRQWDQIYQAMDRFEYFSYWTQEQKQECSILSKIKQFDNNEVIFGEQGGLTNFSHFVLSGKCLVLQCLSLKKTETKYETKYELLSLTPHKSDNVQYQFVEVGTLNCGAVFGLGESLEQKSIIANGTVQCLLIPRYWLFEKAQNKGNIWERIKLYMNATIPSRTAIFEEFLDTQKWKKYRKNLVQFVFANKQRINSTSYFDVPVICRIIGN